MQASTLRPLVMRCGAFGDMVLLTTMIRQLHLRLGQPVDLVSSGPWTVPLLTGQPGVGDIFLIKSRKSPFWLSPRQRALAKWLRARGPGPTWFCDPGPVGRDLLRRGDIPDAYVCEDAALPTIPGEHFVDRWIRFAHTTPTAYAGKLPETAARVPSNAVLEVSAARRAQLDAWLARRGLAGRELILIQAGNKRTMRRGSRRRVTNTKYWPEERWAEVIRALREQCPHHAILLLGVPAELQLNADIARLANVGDLHNVADDLPIDVLLPLLERASSMVSVDTGPAHAAAALGCPTVALFGNSDPQLYRPGGVSTPAVALTGEVDGQRSMMGITPDAVITAWQAVRAR
ncbi:MAG TPA: glycosyltransferase family 9 protein [Steroidobacteraceae bacterium]|nr:glycosyltransferase family 9 protein [Steroidobacteraceae bacterium]